MRVLHVIPGLRNSSGPAHAVVNLTEGLGLLGVEVSLYHLDCSSPPNVVRASRLVETRAFPVEFPRRWGYSPALTRALRDTVPTFDIVHIHSVWMYPTFTAARECESGGVPYVLRPAGSFEPWCLRQNAAAKSHYYRLVERRHMERAAAVHAMTEQERRNLRQFGVSNDIFVVPHGVPEGSAVSAERCWQFRRRYEIGARTPIVLFLSRLHPKKGLDILTAAFAKVVREIPDAKLLIVGPPAAGYSERLSAMVKEHGIDQHTIITGELRGTEKWAAYCAASVFVLPSYSENFGIVVPEAMLCGLPVVVSRHTPWEEVEEWNAGRWLELIPDLFAEHIVDILRDPARAREMGQNGRKLVARKYTWGRIAEKILRVYENIRAGLRPEAGLL